MSAKRGRGEITCADCKKPKAPKLFAFMDYAGNITPFVGAPAPTNTVRIVCKRCAERRRAKRQGK